MMESAMEMEFLHKYLSDEWSIAGYAVNGDTHHVLIRSGTDLRALSFRTQDMTGNGQAEVTGFEEAVFIT